MYVRYIRIVKYFPIINKISVLIMNRCECCYGICKIETRQVHAQICYAVSRQLQYLKPCVRMLRLFENKQQVRILLTQPTLNQTRVYRLYIYIQKIMYVPR